MKIRLKQNKETINQKEERIEKYMRKRNNKNGKILMSKG